MLESLLDDSDFCHDYNLAIYASKAFTNFITVAIAVLNIIIRFMNMALIKSIGYSYET